MRGLKGKTAVITGAASGIGAATAKRFAEEGMRLLLVDIDEETGAKVTQDLEGAVFRQCDVADIASVARTMQDAEERFGGIDVLFNNAGIGCYGRTPDLDPAVWTRVLEVNLSSVFYGCRSAIPIMSRSGGGVIVNTSSVSGLFGDFGLTAYNAAKGAVTNYTRSLAMDHAADGIRVNAVCPGPIETGLTRDLYAVSEIRASFEAVVPLRRVGQPEDIAAAVAFLASDDASFITGVNLVVDGGMTLETGQPSLTKLVEGL